MKDSSGNKSKLVFCMVNKELWESGLAAALGPHALMALLALARYLRSDQRCWPSQKTLAKIMGVSEQTANNYVRRLLDFRLLDGTPLVTAVERQTGRPGHARYEYHLNPVCQVTNGNDAFPIDPALVPKRVRNGASSSTLEKARQAKQERRRGKVGASVPNDLTQASRSVEDDVSTTVELTDSRAIECKNNYIRTTTIRTTASKSALPMASPAAQPTFYNPADSSPPTELTNTETAASDGTDLPSNSAPNRSDELVPSSSQSPISGSELLSVFRDLYRWRFRRSYIGRHDDDRRLQKLIDSIPNEDPVSLVKQALRTRGRQRVSELCELYNVSVDEFDEEW